jgi:hypothetical protein
MSDSLSATVIDNVLLLTISANGEDPELEDDDELELPRPPAVVAAAPPDAEDVDEPLLELEDADTSAVVPAETLSPGERDARDATVPLIGARSFVLASAVSALLTLAWAPSTAACAEATDPAGELTLCEPEPPEGVVLVVVAVVVVVDADSAALS